MYFNDNFICRNNGNYNQFLFPSFHMFASLQREIESEREREGEGEWNFIFNRIKV